MKILKENGITLVALVITVIVLLILSSIATYSGLNVVRTSKFTVFTTEMKIMQTKVNEIYQKYKDGNSIEIDGTIYYGENKKSKNSNSTILDIGQALDSVSIQANKVFTESASGITNKDGYKYWNNDLIKKLGIEGVDGDFFVNVEKRSIISYSGFTYEGKTYYTLSQLPSNLYNVEYEKQNENKPTFDTNVKRISTSKWKITISNIKYDGYIEKWYVKYKKEGQENWQTSEDMNFTVSESGKYIITIDNEEISSEEKQQLVGVLIPGSMSDLTKKDNYTDENGEKATIPEGFTISKIPEESNVSDGLVIYDIPESEVEDVNWSKKTEYGDYEVKTKYNQYVWIPCTVNQDENKLQYKRTEWEVEDDSGSRAIRDEKTLLNIDYSKTLFPEELANTVIKEIVNQIENEEKSIKQYDGYYIGRYEVGNEGGTPVVMQNKDVMNDGIWQLAYENSSKICKRKSVNSYLCSSYSWDTVVNFIQNNGDIDYVTNSSKYNCNVAINTVKDILGNAIKKSGEIKLLNTGVTTQQSNIYDMTGNVAEQTTESNPLESVQEFKIVRGNSFRGESASVSRANHTMKSEYHNICDFVGFRSTIFIK